jgi:hypothetical protein
MKKRSKLKAIVVLLGMIWFVSCNFAPGSYPYAQLYEFKSSETSLIEAIERFKAKNPSYCLPANERFIDGRRTPDDKWYHVWFYYPQEGQVIKCWVCSTYNGNTELGFIGIGNGLILNDYKEINKDFSSKENKLQKEKFEQRILYEIKKQIEK